MDLSSFSANPPGTNLHLLFIHHSVGGQLFADSGPVDGQDCIYKTNPNGGELRSLLEKEGYIIREASYGSEIGNNTDIFDWPPKFKNKMFKVLTCDQQDISYSSKEKQNQIIIAVQNRTDLKL